MIGDVAGFRDPFGMEDRADPRRAMLRGDSQKVTVGTFRWKI